MKMTQITRIIFKHIVCTTYSEHQVPNIHCLVSGRLTDNYADDWIEGYDIYLNKKDQFWPGLETEQVRIFKRILLDVGEELKGSFTRNDKSNLNKPTTPCISDPNYSYRNCMFAYITRKSGCHLDWVSPLNGNTLPASQGNSCLLTMKT